MRACLICLLALCPFLATAQAENASPPAGGYASDQWLTDATAWSEERQRREAEIADYLGDTDPGRAEQYKFRSGQFPALAWNWFDQHPVGFNGLPLVLLQTLLSLDPATETDPNLLPIAKVWRKASGIPGEDSRFTIDHLGVGPHPADYDNGIAKPPAERSHVLPNGFVFDPTVEPEDVRRVNARLWAMRRLDFLSLVRSGLRKKLLFDTEIDYRTEVHKFQTPPKVDAVFFACSACHVGRVVVDGAIDAAGNQVRRGKVKFLVGMPNTEIEGQHYAELLLETGLAMIESGFSIDAESMPNPDDIEPRRKVIQALFLRMIDRARDDATVATIYGDRPEDIQRAKVQTYWVAKDFASYVSKLIGTAVKTHFIYHQVAKQHAFNPNNPQKASPDQKVPDLMNDRPGQMDAFGIASGLVAIHTLRPDGSYVEFMHQDYPENPLFTGIATVPGFEAPADPGQAGKRILANIAAWAPSVPAPIDIKSLNWAAHRENASIICISCAPPRRPPRHRRPCRSILWGRTGGWCRWCAATAPPTPNTPPRRSGTPTRNATLRRCGRSGRRATRPPAAPATPDRTGNANGSWPRTRTCGSTTSATPRSLSPSRGCATSWSRTPNSPTWPPQLPAPERSRCGGRARSGASTAASRRPPTAARTAATRRSKTHSEPS